ncbi:MAG: hypothetical protein QXJ74_10090 [Nitrososphaera sp.]|uniref:hypothetical protein n=1 Tax=Nitrososphaera sp. TaxID=1971748 RepID=UPI001844DEB8|nr:hypothetical protein [Nitrososphaera sp.]NWG37695.1 hypothetical protein [Nitrososphaera sp.]
MDYSRLCEEISQIRDVIAAFVVDKGLLVALAAKPGAQAPDKERLFKILLQIHIMASIPKTNEDFAGPTEYVILQHSNMRVTIIHIGPDQELGIVSAEKPEPSAIIERAKALLRKG